MTRTTLSESLKSPARAEAIARTLTDRDWMWLVSAARPSTGQYPGEYWDFAPKRFAKLMRGGLVDQLAPLNSAHKIRAIATELGRAVLKFIPKD